MYSWLVFVHLVGLVLFAVFHGVSMFAAFRVRSEPDPRIVATHLGSSKLVVGLMYIGLLLMGLGGLGAAWAGGLLLAPWVVASYVVLVIVLGAMYAVGTPYYVRIRELAEAPDVDRAELAAALDTRRPEILATVGTLGFLVLIYLMVLKPG
jgi:uncharacterized membrane protein